MLCDGLCVPSWGLEEPLTRVARQSPGNCRPTGPLDLGCGNQTAQARMGTLGGATGKSRGMVRREI